MLKDSPACTAASFPSMPMAHAAEEVFSPPMVANRRAEAKACKDPMAYRFFQAHPIATAAGSHAQLYLRLAATDSIRPLGELGATVTHVWRPERVERRMRYEQLDFSSVMGIAARSDAVLMDFRLRNTSPSQAASPDLFLRLLSGVEKLEDTSAWNRVASPAAATHSPSRRCRAWYPLHCYDFAVVSAALDDCLPLRTRERMVAFFLTRLMTPNWMQALADDDPAAALSFRTDHSAAGAYASWPARCIRALGRAGRHEEITKWLGVGNPT